MQYPIQNYSLYDAFYKLELRTEKETYLKQGLLFRDNEFLGIIMPRFNEFLSEDLKLVTLSSYFLENDLEFNVSQDCGIITNDYLIYIPLEELKFNGPQIVHIKNALPRQSLSQLRYCMRSHFTEQFLGSYEYLEYKVYSYIFMEQPLLVEAYPLNFLNVIGNNTQQGVGNYYLTTLIESEKYEGSPCVMYSKNQLGTQQTIFGIVINRERILNSKLPNTAIIISIQGIIDFINNF